MNIISKRRISSALAVILLLTGMASSGQSPALPDALSRLGINNGATGSTSVVTVDPEASNASRFVGAVKLSDYTKSKAAKFIFASRTTDPFGQVQDPNAVPKVLKKAVPTRRYPSMKPTAFKDIINRIQVNAIIPGENRFLSNNRSFEQGMKFPIEFRGRQTQVEIVSVSKNQVDFKNLSNGEIASIKVSLLPAGMRLGSGKLNAPGMVVDKPDAPLLIQTLSEF